MQTVLELSSDNEKVVVKKEKEKGKEKMDEEAGKDETERKEEEEKGEGEENEREEWGSCCCEMHDARDGIWSENKFSHMIKMLCK